MDPTKVKWEKANQLERIKQVVTQLKEDRLKVKPDGNLTQSEDTVSK